MDFGALLLIVIYGMAVGAMELVGSQRSLDADAPSASQV